MNTNDDPSRPQVAAVTDGLTTTADKIRALAQAGYKRAEIRKELGVRYQHVRNVLIRSGIEGGLATDLERSPVTLPVDPKKREPTPADRLLAGGAFMRLGAWRLTQSGELELSDKAPKEPGVYAFVVDGMVHYVGLSQRGLSGRMGHYRRGHQRQRTSARIKKLIIATLREGRTVEVLTAVPSGKQSWLGLPIDVAAGLEYGLIRMIQPAWNMQGVTATLSNEGT